MMEELRKLLENAGGSRLEFVRRVLRGLKENAALQQKLTAVIKKNDAMTSSDILEYLGMLEEKEKVLRRYLKDIPEMDENLEDVVVRYAKKNIRNAERIWSYMEYSPKAEIYTLLAMICEDL